MYCPDCGTDTAELMEGDDTYSCSDCGRWFKKRARPDEMSFEVSGVTTGGLARNFFGKKLAELEDEYGSLDFWKYVPVIDADGILVDIWAPEEHKYFNGIRVAFGPLMVAGDDVPVMIMHDDVAVDGFEDIANDIEKALHGVSGDVYMHTYELRRLAMEYRYYVTVEKCPSTMRGEKSKVWGYQVDEPVAREIAGQLRKAHVMSAAEPDADTFDDINI